MTGRLGLRHRWALTLDGDAVSGVRCDDGSTMVTAGGRGMTMVVNGADVALAAGADGAHVGQRDLPVTWARRVLGDDAIIGLSTHSAEQLTGAPADADYLCAGPVHETPTKPGRGARAP